MSAVTVASMAGRHIEAVCSIDELAYSEPWSAATWRRELAGADRRHLVAMIGDQVVAHAGTLRQLDELHVTTVATHPDHRGRGIASRLLVDLLRAGVDDGAVAATLEVRASDRVAQRVYSRLGFAPAGVRPGYYSRPTDDAVIMWLHELGSHDATARVDRVASELAASEEVST